MPDALDERIERSAHCFQTLSIGKLSSYARALPSRTERAVPANDQAIADFRDWHSRSKRGRFQLVFRSGLGPMAPCGGLRQENGQSEHHNRKSADKGSTEIKCERLNHCSPSIK